MENIFLLNNIKMYYPIKVEDIDLTHKAFCQEKSNIYFSYYRKLNFTINEFNSLNLLLSINNELNILQQCEALGLPTHIDYQELIKNQVIDCGFLEGINYLYTIYKNKYNIIKIDLPETHLHPIVQIPLLKLISTKCKQLIIFTYSSCIFQYVTKKQIFY